MPLFVQKVLLLLLSLRVAHSEDCLREVHVNEKLSIQFNGNASLLGQALRHNIEVDTNCKETENPDLCNADIIARRGKICSHTAYDIVQIGAHAGDSGFRGKRVDRVFEYLRYRASANTRAILMEPMRDAFERLTKNYRGSQAHIFYMNAALGLESTLMTLYTPLECESIYAMSELLRNDFQPGQSAPCVRDVDATIWTAANAEHVRAHLSPGSEVANTLVLKHNVPALSWTALIDTYQISDIGLLMLDVEGKDCILLLEFPFHILKPQVIEFEHAHCDGVFSSSSPSNSTQSQRRPLFTALKSRLNEFGYSESRATGASPDNDIRFVLSSTAL